MRKPSRDWCKLRCKGTSSRWTTTKWTVCRNACVRPDDRRCAMAAIGVFLEKGWNDHVTDLAGVAARLDGALPLLKREPAQAGDFLALAEHVLVAHLGDADAMARWIDRIGPM